MSNQACHRCGTSFTEYRTHRDGSRLCPTCYPSRKPLSPAEEAALGRRIDRLLAEDLTDIDRANTARARLGWAPVSLTPAEEAALARRRPGQSGRSEQYPSRPVR